MKKYNYFVGIDVSRNKLDCALIKGRKLLYHKEIINSVAEIRNFITELKALTDFSISKAIFGMEQTGIYTAHLLSTLKGIRANVVLEDALHIKSSLGKSRGKYDKLDAIRIATYLYKCKEDLKLWEPRRPIIDELHHLSTLRFRLIGINKSMQMPLKEIKGFLNVSLSTQHNNICNNTLLALKNDIDIIDQLILKTIKSDSRLNRLFEVITSIPNIGPVTAVQVIVTTNEFKDINDPKKYASYAGVAPFRKESGTLKGKAKVSPLANKRVKSIFHICAMSTIAHSSELKDYYLRKTQIDGKPKMSVLNAVRNKLILRIFACVNQDRCFEKQYSRPSKNSLESNATSGHRL
jgi:transposase